MTKDRLTHCVVIDVETTGLRATLGDRILEIAAVAVAHGQIVDQFHRVLTDAAQRGNALGWQNEDHTGLTHTSEADALSAFGTWVGQRILVAHHAAFDRKFLDAAYVRQGRLPLRNPWFCTEKLARQRLPGRASYTLSALCHELGLAHHQPHNAMPDALACARLLRYLFDLHDS